MIRLWAFAAIITLTDASGERAGARAPGQAYPIYDCKDRTIASNTICRSRLLRVSIQQIETRYRTFKRTANAELSYLLDRDREYFRLSLNDCQNLPSYPEGTTSCIETFVARQSAFLKTLPTKASLLVSLTKSRSLDAGLVERYPATFLDQTRHVCGDVYMSPTVNRLTGTFWDSTTKRKYPVEYDRPTESDLNFYRVHPGIFSCYVGRFERKRGRVTFVALNSDDEERWFAKTGGEIEESLGIQRPKT